MDIHMYEILYKFNKIRFKINIASGIYGTNMHVNEKNNYRTHFLIHENLCMHDTLKKTNFVLVVYLYNTNQ